MQQHILHFAHKPNQLYNIVTNTTQQYRIIDPVIFQPRSKQKMTMRLTCQVTLKTSKGSEMVKPWLKCPMPRGIPSNALNGRQPKTYNDETTKHNT